MVPELLISITGVSLGALFLHRIILMRLPVSYDDSSSRDESTQASDHTLVVCVHDGAELLHKQLPEWLDQRSATAEILLIDDGSQDGSAELIHRLASKHAQVRALLHPVQRGKKAALREGLASVQSDYILLTDVDCAPASTDWSRHMRQRCQPDGIVLGYSPIRAASGWVSRLARYENLLTAVQYLSAAHRGRAYMGVGRNLLYHESVRAYFPQDDDLSGDDDLLVQAAADAGAPISTCTDPAAWTWTDGPVSFGEYYRQRRRQISVSGSYGFRQKAFLMSHSLAVAIFYLAMIGLLLTGQVWWMVGSICAKALIDYLLLCRSRPLSIDKDLWWWLIILDPLLLGFHICVGASLLVQKTTVWK